MQQLKVPVHDFTPNDMVKLMEGLHRSLFDLLSNHVVLHHLSPYIGVKGLLHLAATSKILRWLVLHNPETFNYVDLSPFGVYTQYQTRKSQSREVSRQSLYHDALIQTKICVSGLSKHSLLDHVRILILDGHGIPVQTMTSLLMSDHYCIRVLSLSPIVWDEFHCLGKILRYMIRHSRPKGQPKLKAIYLFSKFGSTDSTLTIVPGYQESALMQGVTNVVGARLGAMTVDDTSNPTVADDGHGLSSDPWYSGSGEIIRSKNWTEFSSVLEACAGIIAFDAVLCRHDRGAMGDPLPHVATVALKGCQSCGSCPEGPAKVGTSPEDHLPLLSPPPLHSYSVRAAQDPGPCGEGRSAPGFIARCRSCLEGRWCETCNAWWCENCYSLPGRKSTWQSESQTPDVITGNGIKVHNDLCVEKCLMGYLLERGGEGGMWG